MTTSSHTPKIIFVHGCPTVGGAEILRTTILAEIVRRGWETRVCLIRPNPDMKSQIESLGIAVDELHCRGSLLEVSAITRLSKYLAKHKPTVVQASQFLPNFQTLIAAYFAKSPKVVIEEHGLYTWKKWYHKFIDRFISSRADAIVACSQCVADFASNVFRLPKTRVTVNSQLCRGQSPQRGH